NPDKVRPIPGGSKSCALNSLDIALTLDDQVHVRAPKLRKNLIREKSLYTSKINSEWKCHQYTNYGETTTVEGVARSVGFSDGDDFRRAFERCFGIAPSAYRGRFTAKR
ncbi:MAG: hypothetical protein ABSD75_32235, partial [Terriglobales bacterium]